MKTSILALLLFTTATTYSFAQQFHLSGDIRDKKGAAVSFASVYIKNTTQGISANIDGHYRFELKEGLYTVVYKAIGYQTLEQEINIKSNLIQNIVLTEEAYTLSGVTIDGNAEDPAYEIIRQAIRKRKSHLKAVPAYTADVYIKGVQKLVGAPKKIFGRDVQKILELDTNRKGMLYLSESTSTFAYQEPARIHEEMISSKTAGQNNAFSFNKASDLIINFYENVLLENKLSSRGFVSPIADNALSYYRYKLLGLSTEKGETINKIQVIARRENDPVFRGIIYIKDDTWDIVNIDVHLTKATGINLLDTLNISQQFLNSGDVYVPSNIHFQFNGNIIGFKFEGYYIGVFSNYNLQPKFPKNYFNGEILKITTAANKKDSLFWLNSRPIPLTNEERNNYIRKDSIALRKTSRHYLDSVESAGNKFNYLKFTFRGHNITNRFAGNRYAFDPLFRSIFYNTVEGLSLKYGFTYTKDLKNQRYFNIRPEVRYGFSNQIFTGNLSANYYYNPIKKANIFISGGSGIYDLNNYGSIKLLGNSINSLLFETNFSKFYKKEFANIATTRELLNGLQANIGAEYSRNTNLINTTDFKIKDLKGEDFSSNNPFTPDIETPLFPTYKAFTLTASLNYTFGQTYISRPDGKFYQQSDRPVIDLSYRKGIKGLLNSDMDYDLVSLEISQTKISAGLWGYSSFVVGAGKFLNNDQIYYPEFKHFRGNKALISLPELRKFHFLDFYLFSTDREYLEAHFEHNFSGRFSNKVPFLRKLKLEELIGASYLTQPVKKDYTEFYFGFQRLIFRATYGFAYDGGKQVAHGFRFSYGL